MRDAIEMIVKALVDESESVDIREVEQRNGATLIEVRVAPNDVGKIIGKQGKTIRALRSLARIAGAKKNRRYLLEIVEELLTDFPERFEDVDELVLVSPRGERSTKRLDDYWFQNDRVVLKLSG